MEGEQLFLVGDAGEDMAIVLDELRSTSADIGEDLLDDVCEDF
jgi:hypothetical protein